MGIQDCFDFDPMRVYACIDSDNPNGSSCGVGCTNCPWWKGVQTIIGHATNGSRFARPVTSLGGHRVNSRDAFGVLGDIRTNRAYLFPEVAYKEFGVCYRQTPSVEGFDMEICQCYPPVALGVSELCPPGTIAPGLWPDCFLASGCGWKPIERWCRPVYDNESHPTNISLSGCGLDQMNSVRANGAGCTNNWLVMAVGRVKYDSGCNPIDHGYEGFERFIDGSQFGGAALWDTAHLTWHNPRLVIPGYTSDERLLELTIRNDILSQAIASFALDQIDNPSGSVSEWGREFVITDTYAQPRVKTYTDAYLLPSRTATTVRLKIRRVVMRMSMVLHRKTGQEVSSRNVWPSVRFEISVECTPVFTQGIYHDGVLTGIENDERLILMDQGLRVEFPFFTTWKGGRGERAADMWEDIYDDTYWTPTHDWGMSCRLANSFNTCGNGRGYEVGGLPLREGETEKRMYDGYVRIRFLKTAGWCPGL